MADETASATDDEMTSPSLTSHWEFVRTRGQTTTGGCAPRCVFSPASDRPKRDGLRERGPRDEMPT